MRGGDYSCHLLLLMSEIFTSIARVSQKNFSFFAKKVLEFESSAQKSVDEILLSLACDTRSLRQVHSAMHLEVLLLNGEQSLTDISLVWHIVVLAIRTKEVLAAQPSKQSLLARVDTFLSSSSTCFLIASAVLVYPSTIATSLPTNPTCPSGVVIVRI